MLARFFRRIQIKENRNKGYTIRQKISTGEITAISFRGRGWLHVDGRVYSRGSHGIKKNERGKIIRIDEPDDTWHNAVVIVQFERHKHPLRLRPEEISNRCLE